MLYGHTLVLYSKDLEAGVRHPTGAAAAEVGGGTGECQAANVSRSGIEGQ